MGQGESIIERHTRERNTPKFPVRDEQGVEPNTFTDMNELENIVQDRVNDTGLGYVVDARGVSFKVVTSITFYRVGG